MLLETSYWDSHRHCYVIEELQEFKVILLDKDHVKTYAIIDFKNIKYLMKI